MRRKHFCCVKSPFVNLRELFPLLQITNPHASESSLKVQKSNLHVRITHLKSKMSVLQPGKALRLDVNLLPPHEDYRFHKFFLQATNESYSKNIAYLFLHLSDIKIKLYSCDKLTNY